MLILVAACDSGCEDRTYVRVVDSGTLDAYVACRRVALSSCNPLTQAGCGAGEKCTWIVNALTPQYIGHVGCAPIGSASLGESCSYGPPGCDGYDNCATTLETAPACACSCVISRAAYRTATTCTFA